jgi:hypothetical protein
VTQGLSLESPIANPVTSLFNHPAPHENVILGFNINAAWFFL